MPDFLTSYKFSTWSNKKVRTIHVSSYSKHPIQRSISKAISIAKPYDRIELTGGDYTESISISIPLEIVASEGEDPHLISRNSVITITNNVPIYLERLRITCKSTSKHEAGVVMSMGTPLLRKCAVNSLIISGAAEPRAEECSISESYNGYGVVVTDSGGGTLHRCTIHSHRKACMYLDTKGKMLIGESKLFNYAKFLGDVLYFSGSSRVGKRHFEASDEGSNCRKVEVKQCQIYVTEEVPPTADLKFLAGEQPPNNITGQPCCIVIEEHAEPHIIGNDLFEGRIGILLDHSGEALLESNTIQKQRRCGVLALVDESVSNGQAHNVKISGENIFKACEIGIEIQRRHPDRETLVTIAKPENIVSRELPAMKDVHQWTSELDAKTADNVRRNSDKEERYFLHESQPRSLTLLKEELRQLSMLVVQGLPSALTHPSTNVVIENLYNTLGTAIELPIKPPSAATEQSLLTLRGNNGVDISRTRFIGCTVCCIHFGRHSYGLVEDCLFDDCKTHAIVVESAARPLIVGCRFYRSVCASILAANFADPLVVGNEFMHGDTHAAQFTFLSRGLFLGNVMSSFHGPAILVEQYSSPLIAGNYVAQNNGGGALITSRSQPTFVFNTFIGNCQQQVDCADSSNPFIAHNQISGGTGNGIRVGSCSRGTMLRNDIFLNSNGILVEVDGDPIVEGNRLVQNTKDGVHCCNNALGTFLGNIMGENCGANIRVKEGSYPVFRDNSITLGGYGGIVITREGSGLFERNSVYQNSLGNIIVSDPNTNPSILRNTISSAHGAGVIFTKECRGNFSRNSLFENEQCGVYLAHGANPSLQQNGIKREVIGVLVSDGGKGSFQKNEISHCYLIGVMCQMEGDPTFNNNTISRCALSGLIVTPCGLGNYTMNEFLDSEGFAVQLGTSFLFEALDVRTDFDEVAATSHRHATPRREKGSSPASTSLASSARHTHTHKRHSKDGNGGMASVLDRCRTRPMCHVKNNRIHHNRRGGVLIDTNAHGELSENEIMDNLNYGICGDAGMTSRRTTHMFGSVVVRIATLDVPSSSTENCSVWVKRNRISSHGRIGIHFNDLVDRNVNVSENEVAEAPIGIYIGHGSEVGAITKNDISRCMDGIVVDSRGTGQFSNNLIHHCSKSGIYVANLGNPIVHEGNVVEHCGIAGVVIDAAGRGHFTKNTFRRCRVGVLAFTGPAAATQVEYEDIISSEFVTSTPVVEDNDIEENELHGVLVLGVTSGMALRGGIEQQDKAAEADATASASQSRTDLRSPTLDGTQSGRSTTPSAVGRPTEEIQHAQGDRLAPLFARNRIRRNRYCGVYLDNFVHWDFGGTSGTGITTDRSRFTLGGYDYTLGTSGILPRPDHLASRELRQVTFKENAITESSIGVGVGDCMHPLLLDNRITKNYFFGIFLRRGSAAMVCRCEMSENGLAGLYAVNGSKGEFVQCHFHRNNGFHRLDGKPAEPRDFSTSPFATKHVDLHDVEEVSCETTAFGSVAVYRQLHTLVKVHRYAFAEAIHALAEVVVLPSDGHSLGSICVPSDGNILTDSHRGNGGVSIHGYIHLHLSDGGLGMWLEEGSGTTVRECSVEGNLNIGVLLSSGLREHHHVISSCLHRMYGRTNPALAFFDAKTAPERPALAAKCVLALFSPHPLWCPTNTPSGNAPLVIALAPNSSNSTSTTSYSAAPGNLGTNLCAKVISCNISGSGTGMLLELHHAYRALPASSTPELGRRGSCASFSSSHTGDVSMTDRHDSGASGFSSRDIDAMEELRHLHQCMCVEENTITNNHNYGILCQHVVEIHCENYVRDLESLRRQVEQQRESPGGASDLVNMFLSRPRYGLEFHLTVKSPVINNVVIRHNTMGKNPNQGEVTSRYVMVAQDLHRALIQMDTVNDFMSQRYNSEVVHRIPVLAAALQYVPPGCFWWDENQICDCERGIRAVGYLGSCSVRLTRNLFRNISTAAVLVDGHLAACTVGRGNIFEDNATAIRLHVRGSKEEASNTDMLSDTRTRIFQNIFRSCRSTAVVFDEGSSNVLLCYNDFSEGTLAPTVWVGSGASELLIHMNIFSNGALPLVINGADEDGISDCSTVTISGNVFTNNYIGALVCHGACPQFQANLFDGNRRCGLEVIGQGTAPKVQRCMFANHTQHQDDKRPKGTTTTTSNGGGHTHTGVKNNPFPDGTVNVGKKKQIIALVESNRGVRSPEHMETLPCGLIIGPLAGGFYEGNYFQNNDFGIDAVRGGASAFVRPSSAARIYRCIFTRNHVGGVLIRGSDSVEAMARSSIQVEGGDHQLASGYQSTRVETCFFIDNGAEEGCGDVIAMTKGCAKFEGNCFHGTIQAQRGGLSFFTHNTFLPSGLGSKGVPAVKQSDRGACILHESSQCKFEHNEISYRKMGFLGLPGSSGLVLENTMFCCTVGATVSPFSTVEISKNRICHSADAAVVMYGGVVSENLICRSPVGIMLHADTSYSLTPVPEHLRSGENYVECRKNDISQCSVDGIVVTAVCHVDSNQVTHCNKGIHVMNLRRNDKLGPVLEGNFVFDNTTGIHLGDNSICTTRENDVFDNDECGVYISASTQGIFNGNRISSAKEFGAIFLPEDPRLKLGANNIRNQFTPAFQQGNRAHRLRLHQGKLAALEEEVNSVNSQMMSTVTDWSMTATGMEQLMANIHEFAKQTTVATGKEASQLRLRAHMLCHGSDRRATTTGSVPRGISGNDGHSGAPNCIVRPAVIYTLASNSKRRTLTHLGDTVINILNSQSLRQLRLSPILASSSTELTSFLEESSMFMCVVVCDRAMREISSDDGVILRRLHNITEGCDSDKSIFQWQPGFPAALTFTILPEVLRAQVKEAQKSEAPHPMSLAEYASLHQPIFYESDVEDSTFALEDALAQRLVRSRCSPTRRKSSVRPAEDSISLVEVSQTLMADGVLPAMNPSLAPAKSAKFKRASVLRPPSIHASGRFSQQNSMSVFTDERASPPSASGRIGQAPPSRKGGRSPSDEFSSRSFSLRESPSLSFGSPRAPSRGGVGQGKPAKSGGRRSGSNSKHSSPRGMPPISHSNSGRPKSRSNHSSRSKGDSGLKMPALSPSRKGNTA